jgi:hypothetical protein
MLELLLRSKKRVRQLHLYVYIRLALARRTDSVVFIDTLLNRFSGFDTFKRGFPIELLGKTI